jgi:hypothetical protein
MTEYPTHEEIEKQIRKIVDKHLYHQCAHNRENLDDIISDPMQYRDTVPTVEDYREWNLL